MVYQSSHILMLMLLVATLGCSNASSEAAAKQAMSREMNKWIAGEDSGAETMVHDIRGEAPPVGFEIKSIVKTEPDWRAHSQEEEPKNLKEFPAYLVNVDIEFKSQAGTPLHNVATYTMTWNPDEEKWYIQEEF